MMLVYTRIIYYKRVVTYLFHDPWRGVYRRGSVNIAENRLVTLGWNETIGATITLQRHIGRDRIEKVGHSW